MLRNIYNVNITRHLVVRTSTSVLQYFSDNGTTRAEVLDGVVRKVLRLRPKARREKNAKNVRCHLQINKLIGNKTGLVYRSMPADDPKKRRPDISRAVSELNGWKPKTTLINGLNNTIDYFKS